MKKIILIFFFVLSFSLQACKTVNITFPSAGIPVNDAINWNERVKVKTTDIYLKNGTVLKNRVTRIKSNEIIYLEGYEDLNDYRTLALAQVKEIHINPQINSNFYVGLGLFVISGYIFNSYISDKSPNKESSFGLLIPFVVSSGSAYFLYQGIETEKTIIKFE
jgi:hypothetical protein